MTRWPERPGVAITIANHRLRRAEPDDEAAIQDAFELDPGFFELSEGAPPRPTEAHELLIEQPPIETCTKQSFVVHDPAGTLVAVLDLLDGFPDRGTLYLGLIFIAPRSRGGGLGRALLEALFAHAADGGSTAVRLAVVVANQDARRLYDRLGFTYVDRRKRKTWNESVIEVDILERAV